MTEWISVKERLPDADQHVFMIDCLYQRLPMIGWYEKDEEIEGFVCAEHFIRTRLLVTHWMPLPEPPKE